MPCSAGRWAPLVVPIPSDIPAHAVQLLDLSRGFADFPAVQLLEAAVTRLARGLDIPLESTIGHRGTTFANADSIDEALLRDHVAPSVLRIVSSISTGYLDEVLVASNMAEGSARYVPDFSELEKDSDRDTLIPVLVKEGVISPAAGREMLGLDESAAPDATATAPATTEVPA